MADLNIIVLAGRLTRDPVYKEISSGSQVTEFGMATGRKYTNKVGIEKDDTVFVDISCWGNQAKACNEYLHKGSPVLIEGRLHLDSWETPEGEKRSKLRVVANKVQFLENKPKQTEMPLEEKVPF